MIQTSRQPRVQLWIPNAAVDKRAASTALEATVSKKEEGKLRCLTTETCTFGVAWRTCPEMKERLQPFLFLGPCSVAMLVVIVFVQP